MKLKTYHAYSMAEALAAVKHDLGADAVILHTRTFKRGGIFGFLRRTVIEVTATPAAPTPSPRERPVPKLKLKDALAQRAYGSASRAVPTANATPISSQPVTSSPDEDRNRTRRLAMAMEETHNRKQNSIAPTAEVQPRQVVAAPQPPVVSAAPQSPPERAARRFLLTSADPNQERPVPKASANAPPTPRESTAPKPTHAQPSILSRSPDARMKPVASADMKIKEQAPISTMMQDELSAIRQMVGQVLQRQAISGGAPSPAMPTQLFEMYLKLISQDISEELASQIVNDVREELQAVELDDPKAVRSAVQRHLAALIPVSNEDGPPLADDGRPFVLALVGPTGVGKTTTLAKLAATFKLRYGKTVGLVTADTYRIAAVDQLRTYADIIGLPLQVALTPAEMRHAVKSLSECDIILIDTAGRSQKDSGRLAELKRFLAAAEPHEVHLVLSSTASDKVLLHQAQAFSELGIHKIVLTKLDEAASFGMLVNVVRQVGRKLSYVTTGQEVPDHIEPGRSLRLAQLILGDSPVSNPASANRISSTRPATCLESEPSKVLVNT